MHVISVSSAKMAIGRMAGDASGYMDQRLYYIDWLRVLAFGMLILYHSAVGFFPDGFWLITSQHTSANLELVMEHPRVWRLALLFFISGVGTYFAYQKLSDFQFLTLRTSRLVLPLLFAMAVICVPQVWYERLLYDGYEGGFFEFWFQRYFTEGKYPTGHFTWAHMWFIGYLFAITFVFFPFMKLFESKLGQGLNGFYRSLATSRKIYLLFLLPLALHMALVPFFPNATYALYNDGAWFAIYCSWYGLGYLYGKNCKDVNVFLMARKVEILAVTAVFSALMYVVFWLDLFGLDLGSFENKTVIYKISELILSQMMILSLIVFAVRYLNIKNSFISYANQSIFTLYIVHQTIIVGLLYYTIQWGWDFQASFNFVLLGTAVLSIAFYHLVAKNLGPASILLGGKWSRKK